MDTLALVNLGRYDFWRNFWLGKRSWIFVEKFRDVCLFFGAWADIYGKSFRTKS